MSEKTISSALRALNESSENILLSMVISSDGLVIAYDGKVDDPDHFGAYFVELQLVCEKIISELYYGGVEEIFIRSPSGCVTIFPIFEKGFLACMSTSDLNSSKLQLLAWRSVKELYALL